ncbi:MAG TPA: PAS and ANTAR domain-containing protein [Mycobacterium sp.]|nr:PAS and ANTAR domain-containing protein [Mycobacterium sp.]
MCEDVGPENAEDDLSAIDLVIGHGDPQRVGRFRFYISDQRWEWSEAVERMHGYEPGTAIPTTELLLSHKHPDDRPHVEAVLKRVLQGEPFSSRHRIIDTAGRTHLVVVVGEQDVDQAGTVLGTSGFYIDVTESFQSDITAGVSRIAETRAEIEQAKGVLMAAYGISADRAFDILVWRSQETNIKVREIAHRFITAMAGTLPADTRDLVDRILLNLK